MASQSELSPAEHIHTVCTLHRWINEPKLMHLAVLQKQMAMVM